VIVVDASILVPAIVETEKSAKARRVAERDVDWILPPLWKYEFTNSMATFLRTGELNYEAARAALDDALTLVAGREIAVDQSHVLRLAAALSLSGYDAQYIALAAAYGIQCVTDDGQMAKRSGAIAVLLDDFVR
jgi:predicted nucleic acid-binding protein